MVFPTPLGIEALPHSSCRTSLTGLLAACLIKKCVPEALRNVEHLAVAYDDTSSPVAFMGVQDSFLEMLFVKAEERGKGIGRRLLERGIKEYGVQKLSVNEQNPQAKGFYEHMGFIVYSRSELDGQGNPYPLLYMKLKDN